MGEHRTPQPLFNDKVYTLIRRFVEYIFPASIALYFALSEAWGWGYQEQVMASLAALNVFFAAVVGISRKAYQASDAPYDAELIVDSRDPDKDVARLDLTTAPDDILERPSVNFRVRRIE